MKSRATMIILAMAAVLMCNVTRVGASQPDRKKSKTGSNHRIALVLGGGGAKGAAHAGALKVIEEAGIQPDIIVGTSIGSIVGGLYSCGYRASDLQQMFQSQQWLSLLSDRRDEFRKKFLARDSDSTLYVLGFPVKYKASKKHHKAVGAVRGNNIVELLDSMLDVSPMGYDSVKVWKRFRCVAYDAREHQEYVFDHGSLVTAMRASMAIPGAFKPVRMDSLQLFDGGLINNLPCDVARAMGADIIIAIDLTQNHHEDDDERPSLRETLGIGGLLNWAVERPDLKKYKVNVADCDVYINPDLKGYGAGSFKPDAISDMIKRGEKAARKQMKELRKIGR